MRTKKHQKAVLFLVPVALQPTGQAYNTSEHWETVLHRTFEQSSQTTTTVTQDENSLRMTGDREPEAQFRPLALAYFALIYFASMFVATFCNVAF